MKGALNRFLRVEFAPPRYLSMPTAGIDISSSGIKIACLTERMHGLELTSYAEESLPEGAIVGGEIIETAAVIDMLRSLAKKHGIKTANITLPEARSYLFEADVEGKHGSEWRTAVEQHLDEYVPLPPAEVMFDIVPTFRTGTTTHVVGVGTARRVVDLALSVFDDAGIRVRSVEGETFAAPRALLPHGDTETVLIIDIGKTTTKLVVVTRRIPIFATTLDIGGHALTLAVQKYFGVTEEEAKKVKAERGLVTGDENAEYLAAMLSTVSVIREEIVKRLEYWQSRAVAGTAHEPVTRAILVGGNATLRGLPEYLETALKIPVELGDVFANLAKRDDWLPPVDYMQSLAYATAIGLALREYVP
ncbi:MAG: Type pilus assembly protein PilM [Parcubacteria group bacterium]|nr:Type pilus assembly protein PilM [Parcubacteria group bacterium]